MTATVAAVVIFLCGVMVGRGVQHDARIGSGRSRNRTHGRSDIDGGAALSNFFHGRVVSRTGFQPGRPEGAHLRQAARGAGTAARARRGTCRRVACSRDRRAGQGRASSGGCSRRRRGLTRAQPQGNGFVVQVASLKSRGEADTIAKRLSSKGFPSFVTTPGSSGPKVFRVRVGKYADRREAETVARKLEKEEQFKPWITR